MRRIVYLDHAVLSLLAKGELPDLLDELTTVVDADKAVFPHSSTHHDEAELDDRWEDAIRRVGARLSRGIGFRPDAWIVSEQARRLYLNFMGQPHSSRDWRDAYDHDPGGDISPRWSQSMVSARVSTHPTGRDQRRALKELFAASLSATRAAGPD